MKSTTNNGNTLSFYLITYIFIYLCKYNIMQYIFDSEQDCKSYLENLRWPEGVISPFDPYSKVYTCKDNYRCRNTGKYFNVRTGTLLSRSRLELREWLKALDWLKNGNNDPKELANQFGISLKSAYHLLKKLNTVTIEEKAKEEMTLSDWLTLLKQ